VKPFVTCPCPRGFVHGLVRNRYSAIVIVTKLVRWWGTGGSGRLSSLRSSSLLSGTERARVKVPSIENCRLCVPYLHYSRLLICGSRYASPAFTGRAVSGATRLVPVLALIPAATTHTLVQTALWFVSLYSEVAIHMAQRKGDSANQ
jgi:hypothetical protein